MDSTATGFEIGDWIKIGVVSDIPARGARVVKTAQGDVAVFRTADDRIYALFDRCPHKAGPLSQGIVQGQTVTCPLHNLVINLATGAAEGEDAGCANRVAVRVEDGRILMSLAAFARRAA